MGRGAFVMHHLSSDNILAAFALSLCTSYVSQEALGLLPFSPVYHVFLCFDVSVHSISSAWNALLFSAYFPSILHDKANMAWFLGTVPDTLVWLRCPSHTLPYHSELPSLGSPGWNVVDCISLSTTHQMLHSWRQRHLFFFFFNLCLLPASVDMWKVLINICWISESINEWSRGKLNICVI